MITIYRGRKWSLALKRRFGWHASNEAGLVVVQIGFIILELEY